MIKKKPTWLLLSILFVSLVLWFGLGYLVFIKTESIWQALFAMIVIYIIRFMPHIYMLIKCKLFLSKALKGVKAERFFEVDVTARLDWFEGYISLGDQLFRADSAATKDHFFLFTSSFFPRPVVRIPWIAIVNIQVIAPFRAVITFDCNTDIVLGVPWNHRYDVYLPRSIGFQKDKIFKYTH